jgi:hypothetical protein
LRIVAFSRSNSPIVPISWDRLTRRPGTPSASRAAAAISSALFTGENTAVIAAAPMPPARSRRAT